MNIQDIFSRANDLMDDGIEESLVVSISHNQNTGLSLDAITMGHNKDVLVFDLAKGDSDGILAERANFESLKRIHEKSPDTFLVINYQMIFKIIGVEDTDSKGYVLVKLIDQLGEPTFDKFRAWASVKHPDWKFTHIQARQIFTVSAQ